MKKIYPDFGTLYKYLVLSGCLYCIFISAAEIYPNVYKISGELSYFSYLPYEGILISQRCLNQNKTPCEAYSRPKKQKKDFLVASAISGGANLGALFCKRIIGTVVWGLDVHGNQIGFCKFQDESLISLGSLVALSK